MQGHYLPYLLSILQLNNAIALVKGHLDMLLIQDEGKKSFSDDACQEATGNDLLADVAALLEGDSMEEVEIELEGKSIFV